MQFKDKQTSIVFGTEYWWKKIKGNKDDFYDAIYDSELGDYNEDKQCRQSREKERPESTH